jgi:hypothetical protein
LFQKQRKSFISVRSTLGFNSPQSSLQINFSAVAAGPIHFCARRKLKPTLCRRDVASGSPEAGSFFPAHHCANAAEIGFLSHLHNSCTRASRFCLSAVAALPALL